jgi:hypothetical protein
MGGGGGAGIVDFETGHETTFHPERLPDMEAAMFKAAAK